MRTLIQLRWVFLIAALAFTLIVVLPLIYPPSNDWGLSSFDWAMPAVAVLQAVGVFAMAKAGEKRWAVIVGVVSVIAWAVAYIGALLGVAAGAGGLVYGFFLLLPGIAIGAFAQIVALIGFWVRDRAKPQATM